LSLYLNIGGLREGPGKRFDGPGSPGKVLEFFVIKSEGTLTIIVVVVMVVVVAVATTAAAAVIHDT